MSETNKINPFANIKQHSNADLRLPPRQIVADSDPQTSIASQTVINFSFKADPNNALGFQLFIDGRLLREGASNDYTFTNIQADGLTQQVTLTSSISAGLNIIPIKLGVDKEISPSLGNLQSELARRKVYANYINNGTFEYEGVLGWVLYNDSSATPVDGVGGTVNANVTFATTQTNPLRGANSALLSKDAANRQGHGVSYDLQIDMADRNKNLMIRFDSEGSANYQAGYAKLYVYDKTNNNLLSAIPLEIPAIGQAIATFASTSSVQYRLIIHIASSDATAWTLKIDDVQVGQPDLIFGFPGSDWINSGPTIITATTTSPTKGTVVTDEMWWRRVGDSMEVRIGYRQSTAGTAGSGDFLFQIPTGYTIDVTKLKATALAPTGSPVPELADNAVGSWYMADVDDNQATVGSAVVYDSTRIRFNGGFFNAGSSNPLTLGSGANFLNKNVTSFVAIFSVPIVNWDSSVQLSSSKVEYAWNSDTTDANNLIAFDYGPIGAFIGSYTAAERTKRVRFPNPINQTDHVFVEVKENGNWIRLADHELNPANHGAVRYGIRCAPVASSTTDYDVFFGDGGAKAGGSYAGAGSAWSGFTTLKWRLVKSHNALGVEVDGAPRSEIFVYGGNGHGATDTFIRRFATLVSSTGTAITYSDTAANGGRFIINESGLYAISYTDASSTGAAAAITRNSTFLTTAQSDAANDPFRLSAVSVSGAGANQPGFTGSTLFLAVGDIIRAHNDSTTTPNGTSNGGTTFRITKVGN